MATLPTDIVTPNQAADYLQVNPATVYRYIREGKLLASKIGRGYRIPRRNLELLLWTMQTRPDIALRDYGPTEIAEFLRSDELDERNREAIRLFEASLTT